MTPAASSASTPFELERPSTPLCVQTKVSIAAEMRALVVALGDDDFATREHAQKTFIECADLDVLACLQAVVRARGDVGCGPDLERCRRAERILEACMRSVFHARFTGIENAVRNESAGEPFAWIDHLAQTDFFCKDAFFRQWADHREFVGYYRNRVQTWGAPVDNAPRYTDFSEATRHLLHDLLYRDFCQYIEQGEKDIVSALEKRVAVYRSYHEAVVVKDEAYRREHHFPTLRPVPATDMGPQ